MIERKVATLIKADIKEKANSSSREIELTKRSKVDYDTSYIDETFVDYQTSTFIGLSWYNRQNKYRLAYAMITNKVFDSTIGKQAGIDEDFVQKIYSEYSYIKEYIDSTEQEWKDTVHTRAQEFDVLELKAAQEFRGKHLLEQIVDKAPPRYFCQVYLDKLNKRIRDLREEKKYVSIEEANGELDMNECISKRDELKELEKDVRKQISWMLKKLGKNKDSEKRIDIIKASKRWLAPGDTEYQEYIEIGNNSRGYKLIDDYCRWYRDKYELDLAAKRKEEKNLKQQERYNKVNASKKAEAELQEQKDAELVLKYHNEGMSARKMEQILPFGRSKIAKIIFSYKSYEDETK